MKLKTIFVCTNCQFQSPKWQGKCPQCGKWNTMVEDTVNIGKPVNDTAPMQINTQAIPEPTSIKDVLRAVKDQKERRNYEFAAAELNAFWGKGLTAGSLTLLAGEPGLGKSTFALQILRSLFKAKNGSSLQLLYITAEESNFELARRSERLQIPDQITLLQSNNYEQIEQTLTKYKPQVVIIDSVQTVTSSLVPSNPGSVSQVSTIASRLLALSKAHNISIVIIGHVTKDGQIAGPKTLEHLVDSVLILESSESPQYRMLSFSKHRFGTTSSLLLLKMEENGLQIVTDPSLALLENLETGIGVVYALGMDKDLPLVVEIQALVGKPSFSEKGGFGRREALGIKVTKLNTILAIIEKYLGIELKSRDVYVQIFGLPKSVQDDSLDMPILLSIISSLFEKPVQSVLQTVSSKPIFAGRLTLSGKIRHATSVNLREDTAKRLGFEYNPTIAIGDVNQIITSNSSKKSTKK